MVGREDHLALQRCLEGQYRPQASHNISSEAVHDKKAASSSTYRTTSQGKAILSGKVHAKTADPTPRWGNMRGWGSLLTVQAMEIWEAKTSNEWKFTSVVLITAYHVMSNCLASQGVDIPCDKLTTNHYSQSCKKKIPSTHWCSDYNGKCLALGQARVFSRRR